ncbi:hypothetical protein GGR56DRAFT_353777 [Xylariaceae sp. FL0804]|nr:hypothetical protein GGR56DRAFT_353777 [Xylariaceae sp. FL0804]
MYMFFQQFSKSRLQPECCLWLDTITDSWWFWEGRDDITNIPLWICYYMEVLADIQLITDDKAFTALRTFGRNQLARLRSYPRSKLEDWASDRGLPNIRDMIGVFRDCVEPDPGDEVSLSDFEEKYSRNLVPASSEMLESHPLLCGMIAHRMLREWEKFQISQVSICDVIVPAAHLYYGIDGREGARSWGDMDHILGWCSELVFQGPRPRSAQQHLESFIGCAKDCCDGVEIDGEDLEPSVSRLFATMRLSEGGSNPDLWSDWELRGAILAATETLTLGPDDVEQLQELQTGWCRLASLPAHRIMDVFKIVQKDDEIRAHFNWLGMHRRCVKFFEKLKTWYASNLRDSSK